MSARSVLIALALTASAARAEVITEFHPFTHDTSRPDVLTLEGEIGARTGFVFKRAMQRFPGVTRLELATSGGSVYDALPLAYDIRAAGLTTAIPAGKVCASACSYLFFAGVARSAEGRLGVHQIHFPGADPQTLQNVLADVFALFEDFDVPAGIHSKMMATPAEEMFWFEPDQMAALGLLAQRPEKDETRPGAGRAAQADRQPPASGDVLPLSGRSRPVLSVNPAGGGDYLDLAQAIAEAPDGARIEVHPGTYQGALTLTKSLDIIALGAREETVLTTADATLIDWQAKSGMIYGFTLRQTGQDASTSRSAITVWSGAPRIESCDITSSNGAAIYVKGAKSAPTIFFSLIHSSRDSGVVFFDGARGRMEANEIFANGSSGVAIMTEAAPQIVRNDIRDGRKAGVFVHRAGAGLIEGNDIHGNALSGIEISTGADPRVRDNRVYDNNESGILVQLEGRGTIEENHVYANAFPGVAIGTGADPILRGNVIRNGAQSGVIVFQDALGEIIENQINENANYGISISTGARPVVRDNVVTGNHHGIYVADGGGGEIIGNDLRGNRHDALRVDQPRELTERDNLT